jgi:hypothetical protein
LSDHAHTGNCRCVKKKVSTVIGYETPTVPAAVHAHMRTAVRLFDEAGDLALEGHRLLDGETEELQVHEAARLLAEAGFRRVQGVAEVRRAWLALQLGDSGRSTPLVPPVSPPPV